VHHDDHGPSTARLADEGEAELLRGQKPAMAEPERMIREEFAAQTF
jgi:hypothetical protein